MSNIYVDSFKTFFNIGAFTIGGGYAMIPMIESEIVEKKQWITKDEFTELIAIAQSCPGVFAINVSIFIGYKLRKTKGALAASIGTALPSFLIILVIAMFFKQAQDNAVLASIFKGIRPAVAALIAVPTYNMAKKCNISWSNVWIPIASAILIWAIGVNPIYIIILAGLGGYVYGKIVKQNEE